MRALFAGLSAHGAPSRLPVVTPKTLRANSLVSRRIAQLGRTPRALARVFCSDLGTGVAYASHCFPPSSGAAGSFVPAVPERPFVATLSNDQIDHVPVMVKEVVSALARPLSGRSILIVDATAGHGGHSEALLRADPHARVVCIDADASALAVVRRRLASFGNNRVAFFHGSYSQIGEALEFAAAHFGAIDGVGSRSSPLLADGLLLDLGVGSHQLADASRGFSYRQDGRLDMRYDTSAASGTLSAEDIVSTWSEADLADLIVTYGYGQEARAGRSETAERAAAIAKAICAWRGDRSAKLRRRITSTFELRFAVERGLDALLADDPAAAAADTPKPALEAKAERWGRAGDRPNTQRRRERDLSQVASRRTRYPAEMRALFQALRVAVNNELPTLAATLSSSLHRHLSPGGRVVVLSFQPHESQAVQAAFNALTTPGLCPAVDGAAALVGVGRLQQPPVTVSPAGTSVCPCGSRGGAAFSIPPPDSRDSDGSAAATGHAAYPLRASEAEVKENRRSRSVRMMVLQRDCTCATVGDGQGEHSRWASEVQDALRAAMDAVLPKPAARCLATTAAPLAGTAAAAPTPTPKRPVQSKGAPSRVAVVPITEAAARHL